MKKLLVLLAGGFLLVMGCNKTSSTEENLSTDEPTATQRHCAANDVLEEQLKEDPTLQERMKSIEEFTRQVMDNPQQYRLVNGVVEIPVVFNVLYRTDRKSVV